MRFLHSYIYLVLGNLCTQSVLSKCFGGLVKHFQFEKEIHYKFGLCSMII